jgi:glycerol uptake facilitator protein
VLDFPRLREGRFEPRNLASENQPTARSDAIDRPPDVVGDLGPQGAKVVRGNRRLVHATETIPLCRLRNHFGGATIPQAHGAFTAVLRAGRDPAPEESSSWAPIRAGGAVTVRFVAFDSQARFPVDAGRGTCQYRRAIPGTRTMSAFTAELMGTLLLVLLGDGVVANVLLNKTKGQNAGWIVIATGWGLAVTVAVYSVNAISGAHLNPAVTLGMAAIGKTAWSDVPVYIAAQFLGAVIGATLVWLAYLPHWALTDDKGAKLGVFCTAPGVRHPLGNLITELIGTAVLVLGVLAVLSPENLVPNSGFKTGFAPALVGVIVWSIGLSLGGPTGYAINPARDLGPRIAHFLLPIAGKGGSDWGYAWIPVIGPCLGGVAGALVYRALWPA